MYDNVPEWLAKHGGSIELIADGCTRVVLLAGKPFYRLTPTPASGKHSCAIIQSNNGRRIDKSQRTYASADEAIRGGLDELKLALGW